MVLKYGSEEAEEWELPYIFPFIKKYIYILPFPAWNQLYNQNTPC
jgi:hypothetical protein